MRIDFYHLTASPIEKVLPAIAERLLGQGERLLVVAPDDQAAMLDKQLWTYAPESFLPHAPAGKLDDAEQPVLLAATAIAGNQARNVALADGLWRDEALQFERVFYFFGDGEIDGARAAWRELRGREGAERHYWKQDARGRWSEMA